MEQKRKRTTVRRVARREEMVTRPFPCSTATLAVHRDNDRIFFRNCTNMDPPPQIFVALPNALLVAPCTDRMFHRTCKDRGHLAVHHSIWQIGSFRAYGRDGTDGSLARCQLLARRTFLVARK